MDKVVRFPRGLAGFETERDFILLQIRPEAPLLILQSVHTPQVGLLVADPYSFLDKSYAPVLGPAERQLLQLEDPAEAVLLREQYDEVSAAWHFNKRHWNAVRTTGDLPDGFIREQIRNSYLLVLRCSVTPKALREEILAYVGEHGLPE